MEVIRGLRDVPPPTYDAGNDVVFFIGIDP